MGLREKIILGVIGLLVVIIPTTSFVISYRFRAQTKAEAQFNRQAKFTPLPLPKEVSQSSPLKELKKSLDIKSSSPTPTSSPEISFGPTLSFKLSIEGRPTTNQSAKTFLGIAQGGAQASPNYLLSFNVDVGQTGAYSGLSLAGLSSGEAYTAYIKTPAQVATSSAFILKPSITDLGVIKLITGDLNEDNLINSADYSIAKQAYGATQASTNWNPNIDFNLDGVINGLDLAIILKNMGKTGSSGPYYSKTATKSGSLKEDIPRGNQIVIPTTGGHWLFVPQF